MKKLILFVILFCILNTEKIYGMSIEDYDFSDIQQFLEEDDDTSFLDFGELLEEIMGNGNPLAPESLADRVKEEIFGELKRNNSVMAVIIMVSLSSAVFVSFTAAFETGTVSKTAVIITRLIMVSVLLSAFANIISVISDFMDRLVELMNAMLPAYVLSVTFSAGTATGTALKQMAMLAVTVVDRCIVTLLLPLVRFYVVITLINSVSGTVSFKKMCQLLKTLIIWLNNTLLAFVVGMNVIKNMVSPYADQAANAVFNKAVSFIPGIGNGISGISEVVIGTGKFIRNSIGVAGLIIVVLICLFPIIKMTVFSVMYKLCGALLEPVADKKIVEAISCVGDGVGLLMKISCTGALMFMITIGMVCI